MTYYYTQFHDKDYKNKKIKDILNICLKET